MIQADRPMCKESRSCCTPAAPASWKYNTRICQQKR